MSQPCESYIVCEGYHDRAFWAGLLERQGCKGPEILPDGSRKTISDPFGKSVTRGQFGLTTPSNRFIRIRPANGKNNVLRVMRDRLMGRQTQWVEQLVVCVDSDKDAADSSGAGELTTASVLNEIRQLDPGATPNGADILMDAGKTKISIIHWSVDTAPQTGVPNKQTLERLICSAIVKVKPQWAEPVQDWLNERPDKPAANPKEHAFSYLAGWYAHTASYEGFCAEIWRDKDIASALEQLLKASGAWSVVESLVG